MYSLVENDLCFEGICYLHLHSEDSDRQVFFCVGNFLPESTETFTVFRLLRRFSGYVFDGVV